jgi:hypothetical protein
MDGLGSARGCKNVLTLPFTSVSLVRSMDGSIPECVWSMSSLKTLNLAGNGLRGRIGSVSSMPSLLSLTLSHNYLSGEIQLWLQEKNLLHLDLSHNKLTGDVDGFKHQSDFNSSSLGLQSSSKNLSLSVNRLSGDLPSSFGRYADLDILSGNLFGCDHIPKNDDNSDSVSCGSEQYDQSMIAMGGVLGLLCCLAMYHIFCLFLRSSISPANTAKDDLPLLNERPASPGVLLRYARYYQTHPLQQSKDQLSSPPSPEPLQATTTFGSFLSRLMVTTLCLLLTVPVYVLKQLDEQSSGEGGETQYITHTEMYNWLWTMAFVSGTTPAILLLLTAFVCLSYFNLVMNRLGRNDEPPSTISSRSLSSLSTDQVHYLRLTAVWAVFIINILVVGTVNGLYVWSTLLDLTSNIRLWIQLSFALFSSLWSVALRVALPSQIKESRYGVWLFICLNVVNIVLIPCLVTALSTPSCYQVLLLLVSLTKSLFELSDCFSLEIPCASRSHFFLLLLSILYSFSNFR